MSLDPNNPMPTAEAPLPEWGRRKPPPSRLYLPDGARLAVTADQLADGEFMQMNQDVVGRASSEGRLDITPDPDPRPAA